MERYQTQPKTTTTPRNQGLSPDPHTTPSTTQIPSGLPTPQNQLHTRMGAMHNKGMHQLSKLRPIYNIDTRCTHNSLQQLGTTLVQGNSQTNTPGPLMIAEHLSKANIRWQILALYSSSYKSPHNCQDNKLLEWKNKLEKLHDNILIHQFPWKTSFYKQLDTEFKTQNANNNNNNNFNNNI